MQEAVPAEAMPLASAVDVLLFSSQVLFSLAIIGLGVETFMCVGALEGTLIESDRFGHFIGPLLLACGVGLLFKRTMRPAGMALGTLRFSKCRITPKIFAA
jgi:hypothetical protein